MVRINTSTKSVGGGSTITPMTSTRSALFVVLGDGVEATAGGGGSADNSRVEIAVDGRSVRADSNKEMLTQQQGKWDTGFRGKCSASRFAMLACCPCIPAANIHNMLGSSFEAGVLYFGGLVFGMLVSLGLSLSNDGTHPSSIGATPPAPTSTSNSASICGYITLVLLALFLLGVAFLRTKMRHRFNIPGRRAFDCLMSFACCWCVLSQAQSHIEKHNRHEFGLDSPTSGIDTLPAYI